MSIISVRTWPSAWLAAALEFAFPSACPACAEPWRGLAEENAALCPTCAVSLTPLGACCPRCAEPLAGTASITCRRCLRSPLAPTAIFAPWRFGGALATALRALKFRRRRWIARALAPQITPYLRTVIELADIDVVVAVPLHWRRRSARGFDQAHELLSFALRGTPYAALVRPLLYRQRAQPPQSDLPAAARAANVADAFVVAAPHRAALVGKRVLLFDDVITTGATVDAASRTLLRAGASAVIGFAVARAET